MDTFQQPKIAGYRQLSAAEAGLMNEVKALGSRFEDLFRLLREYHSAQRVAALKPSHEQGAPDTEESLRLQDAEPERWLAMGRTDIQTGVMKIVRSIAQPAS